MDEKLQKINPRARPGRSKMQENCRSTLAPMLLKLRHMSETLDAQPGNYLLHTATDEQELVEVQHTGNQVSVEDKIDLLQIPKFASAETGNSAQVLTRQAILPDVLV
jgi:hypothetical protein